jgi:hypothetical protein
MSELENLRAAIDEAVIRSLKPNADGGPDAKTLEAAVKWWTARNAQGGEGWGGALRAAPASANGGGGE